MSLIDPEPIRRYLHQLQETIVAAFQEIDPAARSKETRWHSEGGSGGGRTKVLMEGSVIEKSGVNFSDVSGARLPPSASAARPELEGCGFRAMGVSVIVHACNPYVPTSHMNVRFFMTHKETGADRIEEPAWWFGGGFDLTPFYPEHKDVLHWHSTARDACQPFGEELYPKFKNWCDRYFNLPHRRETRGVGGLFFDDYNKDGFERSFSFCQSVGDHYLPAYLPIVRKQMGRSFTDRERQFQLYRRGRYVEFNLVYDRGTLFGLQTRGRTESILLSMPPVARWEYDWSPDEDSPEENLYQNFLQPKDWLGADTKA